MRIPITILAVDNDVEDLELIEDTIADLEPAANFKKITDANKVLSFLDSLNDTDLPCLIILDYNMPEINGAEITKSLCEIERYKDIPKIILSTSGASLHIEECLKNGATKYFVKPNNLSDMKRIALQMLTYCN